MKLLLFSLSFLAIVSLVFSAIDIIPPDKPRQNYCHSYETGTLNLGQKMPLEKQCGQAACGKTGTLIITTCGVAVGSKGATKPDLTKPYPECCPKPIV